MLKVVERLLAVEEEAGAFYAALSRRFADHPDLGFLWSELAEDEKLHARLLGQIREGLIRGTIPAEPVRVQVGAVESALHDIRRQREQIDRGGMSIGEALAATIALETSEVNDALTQVVADVRPYLPSLPLGEGIVTHLRRLLTAVDRLSHPELTVVLQALVDRAERRATPRKILVVDDEADMRETCLRILRRDGYQCLAATDGQDALELLEGQRPDLILTDLRMPRVDGLTLLRHVRRLPSPPPVVVFTAYVSERSIREALETGAAAYLPKPFTPQKLRDIVEPLLSTQCPPSS